MQKFNRKVKIKKKEIKIRRIFIVAVVLVFFIFILLGFVAFKVLTLPKFSYVLKAGEKTQIVVVDTESDKYDKFELDGDLQVETAGGFGKYKIESLWKLSEAKGLGGKPVTQTIVKNFSLPLYLWKSDRETNLNIFQNIKSYLLGSKVFGDIHIIDEPDIPEFIVVRFVDRNISEASPKIRVEDLTGKNMAGLIDQTLGVYGVKLELISRGFDEKVDCEVGGTNQLLINQVRLIFDCNKADILEDKDVDLVIKIGQVFADRF